VYDAVYNEARILECDIATVLSNTDAIGRMPLYMAVKHSQHAAMETLLHMGADVDAGSSATSWSPLVLASWMGDSQAIELLIKHGSNLDHPASHGFTPLAAAAMARCIKSCKVLLIAGASATLAKRLHADSVRTVVSAGEKARSAEISAFIDSAASGANILECMITRSCHCLPLPQTDTCVAPVLATASVDKQDNFSFEARQQKTWMCQLVSLGIMCV
jgi:ankyrin repeat protein